MRVGRAGGVFRNLAPCVDFAVLVCTNQGGRFAANATDEAAWTLIRHYLP